MSVLCGRIPNLALTLATRHQPQLAGTPVALIGRDAELCGVSSRARQAGVQLGMNQRQAQMRCPELTILEADLAACQHAQDAFLGELGQWELPVEAHGMGMAYVDLHSLTSARQEVQGLAAELGQRVRKVLGDDLQPALGWDHSKFCARAAAYHTAVGRMKLVAKEDEAKFLAPLPISYLPLPSLDLQRLQWLGITTLGQFAALPAGAVWQQFGKRGKVAQRWAQGRDNRPVRNMLHAGWSPLAVEFETPTELLPLVIDSVMAKLQPNLEAWAEELQGCTRLRFELHFANHERRVLDLNWLNPVTTPARLRLHVANQFAGLNWPGALDRVVVVQAATAELPALQLSLFDEPLAESVTLDEVAAPLRHRYGPIFLQGSVSDDSHPADERRITLATL
jgi:nucleotidyltransferase/DNA polymerase involved in DNA repair